MSDHPLAKWCEGHGRKDRCAYIADLQDRIRALEAENRELRGFVAHKDECPAWLSDLAAEAPESFACNCGLEVALSRDKGAM